MVRYTEQIASDGSLNFQAGDYHFHLAPDGTPSATVQSDDANAQSQTVPVKMSPDGAFVLSGTSSQASQIFKPWIVQSDYQGR